MKFKDAFKETLDEIIGIPGFLRSVAFWWGVLLIITFTLIGSFFMALMETELIYGVIGVVITILIYGILFNTLLKVFDI